MPILILYDLATGLDEQVLQVSFTEAKSLVCSGEKLLLQTTDGVVRLYDLGEGECEGEGEGEEGEGELPFGCFQYVP